MAGLPIKNRGEGVTVTERYLKELCERSFLSLWSYPGLHIDKGKGQELCDLLVVFEDTVLIFSDKNCEFPESDDVAKDWARWYRRAIADSAKQIYGAERWIRRFPDRIFLDQACCEHLPISLPHAENLRVHRIVVTHASKERCIKHFGGGSGSLMLNSRCVADENPFSVGPIDTGKFVHVLDDTTLDILLQTLDTAPDFIEYLEKKEDFLCKEDLIVSVAGEEELLALYLQNTNKNNEHDFLVDFDLKEIGSVALVEGGWEEFCKSEKRRIQVEANKISYFWDGLIESFTGHFFAGTLEHTTELDFNSQEKLFRILAKENRTRRRFLSQAFFAFLEKTHTTLKASRIFAPQSPGDPYYVFLLLPEADFPPEEYREVRRRMLADHCSFAKLEFPDALDIVGIATESGRADRGSEDLCYVDTRCWTSAHQKYAKDARKAYINAGVYGPRQRFGTTVHEYPVTPHHIERRLDQFASAKGFNRNKVCPCGSGRKIKRCCGAAA